LNLVLDIGNTRSKVGLFEGMELKRAESFLGIPSLSQIKVFLDDQPISTVGLSSVGGSAQDLLLELQKDFNVIEITPSTRIPIESAYTTPETLGMDRKCGAVAGYTRFPNDDVLIVDAGTCITYDLVQAGGLHQGGGISPGYQMRLKAMHHFTERLPEVTPSKSPEIGLDTPGSMRFGSFWGSIAEINGIIRHFRKNSPNLKVILTGGDTSSIEQQIENPIFAAPNLVMEGIQAILLYNETHA